MIEVESEDGSHRRWIRVQENGYVQTLAGPSPIRPTYWFEDTGRGAHTRDGQRFNDPDTGTKYRRIEP